jgi:hypothetical protein
MKGIFVIWGTLTFFDTFERDIDTIDSFGDEWGIDNDVIVWGEQCILFPKNKKLKILWHFLYFEGGGNPSKLG